MTSQGEWSFAYLEGLQMYSNIELQKWMFYENFHEKYFFEMLMDECSKNSDNIFPRTPMDASGWMKKDHREMPRF